MKTLFFLFLFGCNAVQAQDLIAAQQRADQRLEAMKTDLQLTPEQLPGVKQVIDHTEKECELIVSNTALSKEEINNQVQAKRTNEYDALKGLLTVEQFNLYTTASPAPSKANINTSRSSIKQSREK